MVVNDLYFLHKILSSYPIVTLLGPFFLLVSIVLAVYYLRIARQLRFQIGIQEQADVNLRKLSSAVENSPSSIVITDRTGVIEYVNSAFVHMTGYNVEEAIGQNTRIMKSGDQPEDFYKSMWELLQSGKVWRGDFHNKRKDGSLFWEAASISPIINLRGNITHFVAVKENITEKKLMMEQLVNLASFDVLTGLPNRRTFLEHLTRNVELARRNKQLCALMYIDLDGFKRINDLYGHEAGDEILKTAASRLLNSVRLSDTVGRLGGDEFAVALGTISNLDDAGLVAQKILEVLCLPITLPNGTTEQIGASIGIGIFPDNAESADKLLAVADAAMYEVKRNGKAGWRFAVRYNSEENSGWIPSVL